MAKKVIRKATKRTARTAKKPANASEIGEGSGEQASDIAKQTGERWLVVPKDAAELRAWIEANLGLQLVNQPLLATSRAPMDYVVHAFFAGVSASRHEPAAHAGAIDSVVWAHRGGGKTFLGALATVLDMVFRPGIEVRILGGSMEQSKRMHAHLRAFFSEHSPNAAPFHELVAKVNEKGLVLANGSRVELLAQSERSVRGTRVQRLRCDEVDLFRSDVWEAAQLVTRSKQCGEFYVRASVECLSTMHNPSGVMDRVVQECAKGSRSLFRWGVVDSLERCGDEYACSSQETAGEKDAVELPVIETKSCVLLPECAGRAKHESTCGHVSVGDAVMMKQRVALRTWKSEMLCERPKREGVVLEEFDVDAHVVKGAPWDDALAEHAAKGEPAELAWVYGMDFGFRAPTVALVGVALRLRREEGAKRKGSTDLAQRGVSTLWIVDEWVKERMVLSEHIAAITSGLGAWPPCEWIGVDPAGHSTNDQTGKSAVGAMKEAGLKVRTTRTTVEDGLDQLRARLVPADASSMPRLFVHERCAHLIESMQNYRYGEGEQRHVPQKDGHDHAVDALRYLVSNLDRTPAGVFGY
jgi:hypothetical protein